MKDKAKDEDKKKKKKKDPDDGILGWGLAEKTRKKIRDRTSDIDAIVDESVTGNTKKKKK